MITRENLNEFVKTAVTLRPLVETRAMEKLAVSQGSTEYCRPELVGYDAEGASIKIANHRYDSDETETLSLEEILMTPFEWNAHVTELKRKREELIEEQRTRREEAEKEKRRKRFEELREEFESPGTTVIATGMKQP